MTDEQPKRGRGRPKKEDSEKLVVFSVGRVPPDFRERFNRAAKRRGMKAGRYLEWLVERDLLEDVSPAPVPGGEGAPGAHPDD